MVEKCIVLGHVVSRKDIKVNKANIELIVILPPLTMSKKLGNFLVMWAFIDTSSKIFINKQDQCVPYFLKMPNSNGMKIVKIALKN